MRWGTVVNWWSGAAAAFAADLATDRWVAMPGYLLAVAGVKSLEVGRTVRLLERRPVVEALPQAEFDPLPDELARAARLLASAGAGSWCWRARAVRVRLEGGGELDVRYTVEAAPAARAAVRAALGTYRAVEVRDASRLRLQGREVVLELVLQGRAGDALAASPAAGADALQPFTRALEALQGQESGALVLDVLPATPHQQRAIRERLQRAAARAEGELETAAARLAAGHHARGLAARLDPQDAIFRLQAFVIGQAPTEARALEIALALSAGFAQWTGSAHWRRTWGPARWREYRARSGLFGPWRRSLATGRELAAFLRPPTGANVSRRVRRSAGSLADPPRELLDYDGTPDRLPVGAVDGPSGRRPVAVSMAGTYFTYIVGRARSGKTELAILQALHVALRTTDGLMFVDPHQDAIDRIEEFLAGTPAASRVVRIDLGGLGDRPVPGWNLLGAAGAGGWAADRLRAAGLRAAIAAAMRWSDRHVRVLALISRASLALAELGRRLPPELQPTVFQLESLLLDSSWRAAVLPLLSAEQRRFWELGYDSVPREVVNAVLLLSDRLRSSPALVGLLGQPQSAYSARAAMDRGDIVLVSTGTGLDGTLAANLLVCDAYYAARSRAELPAEERRPFWLLLDELQTYDGAASGYVAAMLEEAAKYGLRMVAMNQDPGRLTARTLAALETNRSHLFVGASRMEAAAHMARQWPELSAHLVASQPRRRFVASVTLGHQPSPPFAVHTIAAEELFGKRPELVGELRREVDARTRARLPEDVARDLEELDGRILAALGVAPAELEEVEPEELPADMPPQERARVLVYDRGRSYRGAAAELGVSQTTIRRWIGVLDSRGYPRVRGLEVHDGHVG